MNEIYFCIFSVFDRSIMRIISHFSKFENFQVALYVAVITM